MDPVGLLHVAVLGLMAAAIGLYLLPRRDCPECDHCRTVKEQHDRDQAARFHADLHGLYGERCCPLCHPRWPRRS